MPRDGPPVGDGDRGLGEGGVGGTRCPLPANVDAGLDGGAGGTRAPYVWRLLSEGFILRPPGVCRQPVECPAAHPPRAVALDRQ